MANDGIIGNIDQLIAEEHELRTRARGTGLSEAERARMRDLETQLDQCWDLLRQRRARSEFGRDPHGADVRPPGEVESYQQ